MTLVEFGAIAGVTKQALINYEKGTRSPDGRFFAAIAASGADVLYILTGQRSQPVAPQELLPESDRILLDNYHHASPGVQAGVRSTLGDFAPQGGATHDRRYRKSA